MNACLRVLLTTAFSLFALGCGADTFTAAADPYPPFGDPKHPQGGLGIEIIREALKTQGHDVTMEFVPWARAEAGVKNGTYDILPYTWRTEARLKVLLYSNAFATNNIRFIKRKGGPFEFTGLGSLQGKTIGVVRGYGYGDDFNNATGYWREESNDLVTNVRKLAKVRVDLTLEDEIVARAILHAQEPALLDQIEFVRTPLSVNPLYITVGLQNPRAQDIISAFNKGLDAIKGNGTMERILKRHGLDKALQ